VFERFGAISDVGEDWYNIGIRERYRPGDRLAYISGAYGMPAPEVPDELRSAVGRAYSRTALHPHWRDALDGSVITEVLGAWRDKTTDTVSLMTESLADLARDDDTT
jgi:hypothetical protein